MILAMANTNETRSTCPYCGVGCGVVIESQGAQITGVRGDPEHPANFGRLCTKGSTLHLTASAEVTRQTRLLQPMQRSTRGTAPTLDGYRNHPDESITPLLKEKTWAPVVVDPSHSVGKATYVPACALAAVAYGADGLCIESHVSPSQGIGDDPKQALTPEVLADTIIRARQVYQLTRSKK